MYPFVTISWIHIELTGIGIILSFLVFIIITWIQCKKSMLQFSNLYYSLVTMIVGVYGGGSYVDFILRSSSILPSSITDIYQIILPENYNFHLSGMIIWFIFFVIIFTYQQPWWLLRYKRIDCIFLWLMWTIVVLWIFLVIGDDVIGLSTESRIGIYALTPFSEVAKFNKVHPVGLYISLTALLGFVSSFLWKKKSSWPGRWYGWFGVFLILLSIAILYQNYPRYGVTIIYGVRFDINQYICRIAWVFCLSRYALISGVTYQKMTKRIVYLIKQ